MNKPDAKRIAEDITREQLADMFRRAQASITDWRKPSPVNKSISLGKAWNILCSAFNSGHRLPYSVRINMVWTFGDHLDPALKPAPKPSLRPPRADFIHEDPVFEVLP